MNNNMKVTQKSTHTHREGERERERERKYMLRSLVKEPHCRGIVPLR